MDVKTIFLAFIVVAALATVISGEISKPLPSAKVRTMLASIALLALGSLVVHWGLAASP